MLRVVSVLLALVMVAEAAAAAEPRDLHAYWDQRCAACHGHAGDFARRFLGVEQGRLVGRHHRDTLETFLHQHYLTDELVVPMQAMLAAQVETPPLFQSHCARCHGSGAEFARSSLAEVDGRLVGLPSGRQVSDTLSTHGGVSAADRPILIESLTRIRREVVPSKR